MGGKGLSNHTTRARVHSVTGAQLLLGMCRYGIQPKKSQGNGPGHLSSLALCSPAGHCLATLCRVSFQKTNRITRWATSAEGLAVPVQSRDWAVHSGALGFSDSRLLTGGPLTQALIFMCKGEKLIGLKWKKQWYFILSRLKVESLVLPCHAV